MNPCCFPQTDAVVTLVDLTFVAGIKQRNCSKNLLELTVFQFS